jgi:hypothetical protein
MTNPEGSGMLTTSVASASSSTPAPSTTDVATRAKLDELRVDFGRTINRYFRTLFIVTVLIALILVALITTGFFMGKTMEATVLAASVQVAFGMVLGFVCVYIGLMMTWVGIDAAYSVKGDVGAGAVALKSASPGLLFALGGMLLVGVSLYKRIEYQENGMNLVGTGPVSSQARRDEVTPMAPQIMKTPAPDSRWGPTATPAAERSP